jgi:hypothetical protein
MEKDRKDLLRFAMAQQEQAQRDAPSRAPLMVKLGICILLILGCAIAESFSAGVALSTAFPREANGSSLADTLAPVRYAVAAYMIFGHIALRAVSESLGERVKHLFHALGLAALLTMFIAMPLFSFSGSYSVTGIPDDDGSIVGLAGPALGGFTASLFVVAFTCAHWVSARLWVALTALLAARRIHRALASQQAVIDAMHTVQTHATTREALIEATSKPDALAQRAAVEAAHETALVQARAQELLTQRQLHEDEELADDDVAPLRDVPISLLRQRVEALTKYDFAHFFNILKQKEA